MIYILIFILLFSFNAGAATVNDTLVDDMFTVARATADRRAEAKCEEPPPDSEILEIVTWLKYYSFTREEFENDRFDSKNVDYHPKDLWKDAMAIVWQESWYINEKSQDKGTGFGWGALQWSTAKDNAERIYDWNWEEDEKTLPISNKLQAKYVIGHLLYLKDFYGNRRKAILGYNMGMKVHYLNVWDYDYFNKFAIWRRTIDSILRQP